MFFEHLVYFLKSSYLVICATKASSSTEISKKKFVAQIKFMCFKKMTAHIVMTKYGSYNK